MSKTYISWDTISELSNKIAEQIKNDSTDLSQATLIAVSRGGLIPAGLIAYKLNIRDVRVLKLYSYQDDGTQGEIKDISTDKIATGNNVYVIDDLADSGATLKYIKEKMPNAKLCTLLMKDCCKNAPNFVGKSNLPTDEWIVFPWDE